MTNERVLLRTVAVLAVLAGALLVAGGLGHLQAVMKVNHERPLDLRMFNLLSIGTILLVVGAIDLVCSWRMWRGSRYALLVSAAATVALVLYLALLLTLPERGDPIRLFLFFESSYLAVASVVALYVFSRRTAV